MMPGVLIDEDGLAYPQHSMYIKISSIELPGRNCETKRMLAHIGDRGYDEEICRGESR